MRALAVLALVLAAAPARAEVRAARVVWKRTLPGGVASSPVFLASGEMVLGARDGKLYGLEPADGAVRWSVALRDPKAKKAAAADGGIAVAPGGLLLVGSDDGALYGVRKGKVALRVQLPDVVRATPAVGPDGTIYVGCRDDKLYALAPAGTVKWVFPTGGDVDAVAVVGDTVLAGSDDGTLYALDPHGKVRWSIEVGSPIRGAPAVRGKVIVFGTLGGELRAVDVEGRPLWSVRAGGPVNAPVTVGPDGRVYVGVRGGRVAAVGSDGKPQWTLPLPDHVEAALALAPDGTLAFGCNDRKLRIVSPIGVPTAELVAEAPIHVRPLFAGKRVLFADLGGNVYAVE